MHDLTRAFQNYFLGERPPVLPVKHACRPTYGLQHECLRGPFTLLSQLCCSRAAWQEPRPLANHLVFMMAANVHKLFLVDTTNYFNVWSN